MFVVVFQPCKWTHLRERENNFSHYPRTVWWWIMFFFPPAWWNTLLRIKWLGENKTSKFGVHGQEILQTLIPLSIPKKQVDKQKPTKSEKFQRLTATSQDVAQVDCSMPGRTAEVLKRKGANTESLYNLNEDGQYELLVHQSNIWRKDLKTLKEQNFMKIKLFVILNNFGPMFGATLVVHVYLSRGQNWRWTRKHHEQTNPKVSESAASSCRLMTDQADSCENPETRFRVVVVGVRVSWGTRVRQL